MKTKACGRYARKWSYVFVFLISACSEGGYDSLTAVSQDVLKRCTGFNNGYTTLEDGSYCSTQELSFIGQKTQRPTVSDILNRVVVSDAWMKKRFKTILEQWPPQALKLFTTVTAVVIDDRINPSFYVPEISAIYINPHHLWVKNDELAGLANTRDGRSNYGDNLPYFFAHRYVDENDDSLWFQYPHTYTDDRPESEVFYAGSAVLLHELAHANDFYSSQLLAGAPQNKQTVVYYMRDVPVSLQLFLEMPLESETLFMLGQILFQGDSANDEFIGASGSEFGEVLQTSLANDIYNFSHPAEDVAMLFEEFAMLYFFDANREVTIADLPASDSNCDNVVLAWGVKNAIQNPLMYDRLALVLSFLLPESLEDIDAFIDGFSGPTVIAPGQFWCQWFFQ